MASTSQAIALGYWLLGLRLHEFGDNCASLGLLWWLSGKEYACQAGNTSLIPGLGRSLGGGNGSTPVFLPRKSHGQRESWQATFHGVAESDVT